jgi:hypothetical protein
VIECASILRLIRPELSVIRVDLNCTHQVFDIGGCKVRQSLLWGLIHQKKVHEDIVVSFLNIISPALETHNALARPPIVSNTLFTMPSLEDPTSKHIRLVDDLTAEVKSKRPVMIIFPTFVSIDGVVPYGAPGSHWILLVLDFTNRTWKLFDSLPNTNELSIIASVKKRLINLAALLDLPDTRIVYVKSTRQTCAIDCGIFMFANILGVLYQTSINPFPISTSELRRRIYALLLLGATVSRTAYGRYSTHQPQHSSTS